MLLLGLPSLQQLFMQQFSARQQSRRILRSSLLTLALFLKTTDHGVGLSITARGKKAASFSDDASIKAQPCGNRESVAAAGNSPEQVITRRKGLTVEGD